MKTERKDSTALKLKFLGIDYFCRPVYKDQYGHLWKDVCLGDSVTPSLYSVANDTFEGEPLSPITTDYTI